MTIAYTNLALSDIHVYDLALPANIRVSHEGFHLTNTPEIKLEH
jgi:hypothetical protein